MQITVSDQRRSARRKRGSHVASKASGDFLSAVAHEPGDGFNLTPETRSALDEGLENIRRGNVVSLEEALANLDTFKAKWREQRT